MRHSQCLCLPKTPSNGGPKPTTHFGYQLNRYAKKHPLSLAYANRRHCQGQGGKEEAEEEGRSPSAAARHLHGHWPAPPQPQQAALPSPTRLARGRAPLARCSEFHHYRRAQGRGRAPQPAPLADGCRLRACPRAQPLADPTPNWAGAVAAAMGVA